MKKTTNSLLFEIGYIREHGWRAFASTLCDRVKMRFRKRPLPKTAKIELAPGANRIQFMRDGVVVADLTLVRITWHHKSETEVAFRDTGALKAERTVSRKYPGLTVAEEQRLDRAVGEVRR